MIYRQDKRVSTNEQYDMTVVLCIKESYSKGKKVNIFTFAYGQAGSGDPPPPYGQPDRKIFVFYGVPNESQTVIHSKNPRLRL